MKFQSRKAEKRQLALKILCSGSSGSGKTYSALRLATGIINKAGGEIYLINTEGDRGEMYGGQFNYQIVDLPEPRSPENYIEAIKYCINEGATVIIIDSLSHEWNYLNEQVNYMHGNSFNNWGKQKPRHRKLVDFIIESKAHIIATGRGKDEYVMETNEKGKSMPKKIGVGVQQEKDTEYEYMVTFNITQDTHVASCMKDNTGLFNNKFDVLTEKDGENLYDWANSGSKPLFNIADAQQEIIDLAKELGGSADKEILKATKDILGVANPMNCNNQELLEKSLTKLKEIKKEREINESNH